MMMTDSSDSLFFNPSDIASVPPVSNEILSDILGEGDQESEVMVSNNIASESLSPPPVQLAPSPAKPKATPVSRGYGPKNPKRKKFQCTVIGCNYSSSFAKDLIRHRRKHTGEKPFTCRHCQKMFSRQDKLKTHMLIHTNERPHKCHLCSYATVDSSCLKKHLRTHTNERPYKCQLCSYRAKDSSQLQVHLRYHTDDSPYLCGETGCEAAFKTMSDLQRHRRTHTGEKPYICPYVDCDYKARVKCNLNKHLRSHRKKDLEADTSTLASATRIESLELEPQDIYVPSLPQPDTIHINSAQTPEAPPKTSTRPQRKRQSRSTKLPFYYACKYCSAKIQTLKGFKQHVMQSHKDISLVPFSKSVEEEAKSVIVSPTKSRVLKTDIQKPFECHFDFCSASFARQDSLRCHLKQHESTSLPGSSVGFVDINTSLQDSEQPLILRETAKVYVIVRNAKVVDKIDTSM